MGRENESLNRWPRSHDQDGRFHRKNIQKLSFSRSKIFMSLKLGMLPTLTSYTTGSLNFVALAFNGENFKCIKWEKLTYSNYPNCKFILKHLTPRGVNRHWSGAIYIYDLC